LIRESTQLRPENAEVLYGYFMSWVSGIGELGVRVSQGATSSTGKRGLIRDGTNDSDELTGWIAVERLSRPLDRCRPILTAAL